MTYAMESNIWIEVQQGFEAFKADNAQYFCEYCNINFHIEDVLFNHVEEVHKLSRMKYKEDNPYYAQYDTNNACQICNEEFSNLKNHLDLAHNKMSPEMYYMRYLFQEKSFYQKFGEQDVIMEHEADENMNTETNMTLDDTIAVSTKIDDVLNDPKLHRPLKSLKVENEVNQYITKTKLKKSIEGKYCCQFCDFKSIHYGSTQRHERKHTGEKPFQCGHCDRSFAPKNILDDHVRIHTGEKPFKCEYCNKCFTQRSTLKNHVRTHTGERPFQCEHCDQSFGHKGNLNTHVRKQHS